MPRARGPWSKYSWPQPDKADSAAAGAASYSPKVSKFLLGSLATRPLHRVLDCDESVAWPTPAELWCGGTESCAEHIIRACNISVVISIMSERTLSRVAPSAWLYDSESVMSVVHEHVKIFDDVDQRGWEAATAAPAADDHGQRLLEIRERVLLHDACSGSVSLH